MVKKTNFTRRCSVRFVLPRRETALEGLPRHETALEGLHRHETALEGLRNSARGWRRRIVPDAQAPARTPPLPTASQTPKADAKHAVGAA